MYAIVRAGGKQYRVKAGDTIHVESLPAKAGEKVVLGEVLFVGGDGTPRLGAPLLPKAQVVGTVLEQGTAARSGSSSTRNGSTTAGRAGTGSPSPRCGSTPSRSRRAGPAQDCERLREPPDAAPIRL